MIQPDGFKHMRPTNLGLMWQSEPALKPGSSGLPPAIKNTALLELNRLSLPVWVVLETKPIYLEFKVHCWVKQLSCKRVCIDCITKKPSEQARNVSNLYSSFPNGVVNKWIPLFLLGDKCYKCIIGRFFARGICVLI
jgi:hypothetical protein